MGTIRSMGTYLCPRCLVVLNQVPDIGKDCDCKRRQQLRDYAKDAAARVEDSRRIIFDLGMSVGGELEILKRGSLIPTRVLCLPLIFTLELTHSRTRTTPSLVPTRQTLCRWILSTIGTLALRRTCSCTMFGSFMQPVEGQSIYSIRGRFPGLRTGPRWMTPCNKASAKSPPSAAIRSESLEGASPP